MAVASIGAVASAQGTAPPPCAAASSVAGAECSASAPASAPVDSAQQVVVSGRALDERRDDTASKIVVPHEELQRFGDTNLTDALKRLPGVTVSNTGAISLRGLGSGYTQVLVDGEKMPVGFDIESLSPESVDHIEILRTTTVDLHTDAIAGTINIVLKKNIKNDGHTAKVGVGIARGQAEPNFSWETHEKEGDRSYALALSAGRRNFLVTEEDVQTGTAPSGAPDLMRTDNLRQVGSKATVSVTPSFNLKLHGGDTLSISGSGQASRLFTQSSATSDTTLGDPLTYASNTQRNHNDQGQLSTQTEWLHNFDPDTSLDSKLNFNLTRRNVVFLQKGYTDAATIDLEDRTSSQVGEEGISTVGKLSQRSFDAHTIEFGWDASLNRRQESRVELDTPLPGATVDNSDMTFDARVTRAAIYAQDDWTITNRWSMYLGIRAEFIQTDSAGNQFSHIANREHVLSPVLQTLWKIPGSKNDQIRAALSRTFRAPAIGDLIPRPYTSTNNTPLDPDSQGNPALRPELADGVDFAFEHYGADDSMVSVGGYSRVIHNIIRTDVTLSPDGRWVSSPFNGGMARTSGIELDGKTGVRLFSASAPNLALHANYTRNWSTVDALPSPNNRVAGQIRYSYTVGADYTLSPTWTSGASFTLKAGGDTRKSIHLLDSDSPRRKLDLYTIWSYSSTTKLRLSASDLLHQTEHFGSLYLADDGSTQQVVTAHQWPVLFRATLEMSY